MGSGIPKYPVATFRPGRCFGLYWVPSSLEYGLPSWHLGADDEPPPIVRKPRSRIPRLPAEIIAEILRQVEDEMTLKACARAGKVFRYQAYKSLYEVVPLCFPNRRTAWHKTPRQLLRHLTKYPHIANLIRSLVVHVGVDHADNEPEPLYEIYDDEGRRNLHKVVALLGNLRSLSFPRFGLHYKNHAQKKTITPFFPPLSAVQARNMRELDISALTDEQFPPFECLSSLTNVRKLTTDLVFLGPNISGSVYWVPPLRRLALFGQFELPLSLSVLVDPLFPLKVAYDNVRVLEIEQRDRRFEYIEDIECPRDLTCLNVWLTLFRNIKEFRFGPCSCIEYSMKTLERFTTYTPLAAPPDITPLLSLETIVLEGVAEAVISRGRVPKGHIAEQRYLAACPTPWMAELFQTVSRPTPILEVELRFQVVYRWNDVQSLLEVLFTLWDDLADVLLSWRFPRLKKVKISVDIIDTFPVDLKPFRNVDAYPGLKKLKRAGLLVLEI